MGRETGAELAHLARSGELERQRLALQGNARMGARGDPRGRHDVGARHRIGRRRLPALLLGLDRRLDALGYGVCYHEDARPPVTRLWLDRSRTGDREPPRRRPQRHRREFRRRRRGRALAGLRQLLERAEAGPARPAHRQAGQGHRTPSDRLSACAGGRRTRSRAPSSSGATTGTISSPATIIAARRSRAITMSPSAGRARSPAPIAAATARR